MYKTGVFAGKFLPPHRGHLSAIINSATQCETLYVVVSDNEQQTKSSCWASNLPTMDGLTRLKWLSQELQGFEHIKDQKKKIMVTHVHPAGTIMEKFSEFVVGSTGSRRAIEAFKPDIVLCSHVHEAEGLEEKIGKTRVINVGREGKIIEV